MTDLHEPMFELCVSKYMRQGFCVMTREAKVVYSGPIRDISGRLGEGDQIFLHPDDFATLEKYFKKQVN